MEKKLYVTLVVLLSFVMPALRADLDAGSSAVAGIAAAEAGILATAAGYAAAERSRTAIAKDLVRVGEVGKIDDKQAALTKIAQSSRPVEHKPAAQGEKPAAPSGDKAPAATPSAAPVSAPKGDSFKPLEVKPNAATPKAEAPVAKPPASAPATLLGTASGTIAERMASLNAAVGRKPAEALPGSTGPAAAGHTRSVAQGGGSAGMFNEVGKGNTFMDRTVRNFHGGKLDKIGLKLGFGSHENVNMGSVINQNATSVKLMNKISGPNSVVGRLAKKLDYAGDRLTAWGNKIIGPDTKIGRMGEKMLGEDSKLGQLKRSITESKILGGDGAKPSLQEHRAKVAKYNNTQGDVDPAVAKRILDHVDEIQKNLETQMREIDGQPVESHAVDVVGEISPSAEVHETVEEVREAQPAETPAEAKSRAKTEALDRRLAEKREIAEEKDRIEAEARAARNYPKEQARIEKSYADFARMPVDQQYKRWQEASPKERQELLSLATPEVKAALKENIQREADGLASTLHTVETRLQGHLDKQGTKLVDGNMVPVGQSTQKSTQKTTHSSVAQKKKAQARKTAEKLKSLTLTERRDTIQDVREKRSASVAPIPKPPTVPPPIAPRLPSPPQTARQAERTAFEQVQSRSTVKQ